MSKYYYLIASLPELTLDDSKLNYTIADFKPELYTYLSRFDKKLINLFYLQFDNKNVLRLLENKEATTDTRGNYSSADILQYISLIEKKKKISSKFPSYLSAFISEYYNTPAESEEQKNILWENLLAARYYEYGMNCNNKFVSSWFKLNLTINNILVALTARKYQWEIAPLIVGNTDVCNALRTSAARDFELSEKLSYFGKLFNISETQKLMEREKRLDTLKWGWIDEINTYKYFSIECLYAFLLQLEMIERWISLDKEKGNQMFRSIIDSLKNEVRIPEEFRN